MVLDYSERRPVSKNRPRRQLGTAFLTLLAGALGFAFGLGILTGWYLFGYGKRGTVAPQTAADSLNRHSAPATAQPGQGPQSNATGKSREPALTFYETLSDGNRAVIGSGLNPKSSPEPVPVKPAQVKPTSQPAPAKPPSPTEPAVKPAVKTEPAGHSKETAKAPADSEESPHSPDKGIGEKGKFLVQVASYHTKKEAEAVRDRLTTGGIAAYLVESNIPDKGTWYRVRVGRGLDMQSARGLAEKIGKGAIIIPE